MNLIIILALIMLCACTKQDGGKGKAVAVKMEVKNTASKTVSILLFFQKDSLLLTNDSLFSESVINSGDSMIVDSGYIYPAPNGPSYSLTNILDSASLIFSDNKVLSFKQYNDPKVNNILNSDNYHYVQYPTYTKMQYIITEEDYLRAE